MTTDLNKRYQEAAIQAGQWLVRTQVKVDRDANRGRFISSHRIGSDQSNLSTNWNSAFALMGLLSLHRMTGEAEYLDAARRCVDYIRSLQILDARHRHLNGAIREESPQTQWLHPRDAVSAAWGMLCYWQYTHDADCLERARMFADWMLVYGFRGDWPLCTVNLGAGGKDTDNIQGSFQSGGILFFHDMYRATQDIRYAEAALRMAEYYVHNFLDDDGQLSVLIDPLGINPGIHDTNKWPLDWQNMHRVNDDFGGIALVRSFQIYKREIYRRRLGKYADWVLGMQRADGGFLEPDLEVAAATVPIMLNGYRQIAPPEVAEKLDAALHRSLDHLLSLQYSGDDVQAQGAFLGMDERCCCGNRQWVNLRCTGYAILALLQQTGHSVFPLFDGAK